ncbi:Sodium channel protein para [Folsomia candida]|uniref:Sodium channel protein n=1 Tax=Folsomia candida TaxID=158441 RepID=A0A226EKH8_FOLCA|nr:Sodium channel protein para [Folsomia candida]
MEEEKQVFRPFTRESLVQIEGRISEEYAKKKELEKKRAEGETFVIVTKKKDIFRFSATDAVWLLNPWNPIRRVAIGILTHSLFTVCIICTILTNCFVMILPASPLTESTEVLFTAIYTFESSVKVMARGFVLEKFTYLRDACYITMGVNLGNLAALRTFRVLRALKTVAIIPGLKTIVGAVIESVKNLRDVIILTIFSLSVFALTGLQIYMGILTQICIKTFPFDEVEWTEAGWIDHNKNATNWWKPEADALNYPICGNSSGAGPCPDNYTCLQGYTSFDSFGWALLSAFRLMTQDFWESLYQQVLRAAGPYHMLFFILVIFLGSFYLVNLILAIVAMSYDELQKKAEEDDIAHEAEAHAMREEAEIAARMQGGGRNDDEYDDGDSMRRDSYYEEAGGEESEKSDFHEDASVGGENHINPTRRRTSLSLPVSPMYISYARRFSKPDKRSSDKALPSHMDEMLQLPVPYADELVSFSNENGTIGDSHGSQNFSESHQNFKLGNSLKSAEFSGTANNHQYRSDQTITTEPRANSKSPKSIRNLTGESSNISFEDTSRIKNEKIIARSRSGSFREDRYRSTENTSMHMTDVVALNEIIDQADRQSKMSERSRLKDNPQLSQTLKTGNVVLLSLMEMLFEDAGLPGISALRSFRLLRVFKLAKSWPTLNLLISIMGKTMGALGNLVFVLLIIVFIFAVMGMQLFAKNYFDKVHLFPDGELPRWNFTDFWHSFMIIFRVLCGEWIESMWDCFGASNLSSPQADAETNKLAEAFHRIGRFFRWLRTGIRTSLSKLYNLIKCQSKSQMQSSNRVDDSVSLTSSKTMRSQRTKVILRNGKSYDGESMKLNTGTGPSKKGKLNQKARMIINAQRLTNSKKRANGKSMNGNEKSLSKSDTNGDDVYETISLKSYSSNKKVLGSRIEMEDEEYKSTSKNDIDEYEDDDDVGEFNADDEDQMIAPDQKSTTANEEEEFPSDCFPPKFYEKFPIFNIEGTPFGVGWANLRLKTFRLIENTYFETAVIIMILLSSLALALEDVHLPKNPVLIDILYYMDRIFTVIFLLEMLVKFLALGFRTYFTNAWCWLDFVIVMVSIINFIAALVGLGSVQAFKTMRTLRALRPLRAMSRMQGMRVVVNALVQAIPSIFNVLLVCLIFWLIFAIMGVQLFNGKFYKCIDPIDQSKPDYRIITGKLECLANNLTWENSKMNFDHVGKAYLSLFQVATFKGWIQVMNDAIDSRQEDEQPNRESNFPMYIYFVIFIIFGAFFTLNLFIGVIIDNFNEQKKKAGGSLEMFMTEDQKKYYAAMKKMGSKKPVKAIPRPKWRPQSMVFSLISNQKFDLAIMLCIFMNMIIMTMDHYQQPESYEKTLSYLNAVFIGIFSSESILKIFALRYYYFREPWNLFDFVVVLMSIAGMMLSDLIEKYFVSPTLLRVVRVAKVGRVLRLVKGAKGIRTLLFALAMSLPALFNICLLLFLVMFIFAIFGMSFFMNVKAKPGGLDEVYNFRTFSQSMILLFQMSTSAGWDGVLNGITDEDNCDQPNPELGLSGDCGSTPVGVAFLLSYLVISFLIIINMYIAVILENYSQATEEVQEGLTDDDYDMYYEIWAPFDPDGTQYIKYEQLSDFLNVLEPPLVIHKPNKYKIISMDIPICKGDMMYCVDILDALTRDFFARKGNAIETETVELSEGQLHHHDRPGYEPISSTLWRQREEFCARKLQSAWRKYSNKKKMKNLGTLEATESPKSSFQFQPTTIFVSGVDEISSGDKIPTVMITPRSPSQTSRISDL